MTDWVTELCRRAGVEAEYRGFDGQVERPDRGTLIGVLRALGFDLASEQDARDHAGRLDAEAEARPAPHEIILTEGVPSEIAAARPVEWHVAEETSGRSLAEGVASDKIRLPALPMGVHRLVARSGAESWVSQLLVRPGRPSSLSELAGGARMWGVAAPLYGLTDGAAAAVGDYDLLAKYAVALAARGADFLGLNPVHAMGRNSPAGLVSPYSPSHRAFLNTWHVATPGGIAGAGGLIDYPSALAARDRTLIAAFEEFMAAPSDAPEALAFAAFRKAGGAALREFALFEALADRFGGAWRDWPARYRLRDKAALDAFEHAEPRAILFHAWAQHRADRQLSAAQRDARAAGMRVGLYLDLAVGPRPDGAETWAADSPLATGATLGAPPDPLCPAGQRWGLAPLSPRRCREDGYAGFARLLRAVMRHAGMIRIDHAIGLMRAFWIPDGAAEGAYVRHRLDALLAVVAIESARNRCLVIGEDLGLVPPGLREAMAESGVYGLDVLQYMRTDAGGFVDPAAMRTKAIAAFGTHDTATVAGFFAARDAEVQAGIGMIDEARLAEIRRDREAARASLGPSPSAETVHRMLAEAPSELVAVQLDDIAGAEDQQNIPGTTTEHPNWRRRAPLALAEIETSPALDLLERQMRAAGRAGPRTPETVDDH